MRNEGGAEREERKRENKKGPRRIRNKDRKQKT